MADRATRIEASRHLRAAIPMTLARVFACCVLVLLAACATLPERASPVPSSAFADTCGTRLGRTVCPAAAAHAGRTGVHALPNGRDAFAVRYLLARAAERSIDVQYYIWHADTSGGLLAHALWEAAERGVRVRMLLDDVNTAGLDPVLATLDAHPRIEVRLFNPFANRGWRVGDYVADFRRVNRRMHNKSFTVDNQVAVIGGRNIGDEYLGAESTVAYADLDVVAAGTVVREVSRSFDAYWNSASAYPVAGLLPRPSDALDAQVRDAVDDVAQRGAGGQLSRSRSKPTLRGGNPRRHTLRRMGFRPTARRRSGKGPAPAGGHVAAHAAAVVGSAGTAHRMNSSWCLRISCPDAKARTLWWRSPRAA